MIELASLQLGHYQPQLIGSGGVSRSVVQPTDKVWTEVGRTLATGGVTVMVLMGLRFIGRVGELEVWSGGD